MKTLLQSWPFAWACAAVLHVGFGLTPMFFGGPNKPLEVVEFELAEFAALPPEPEPVLPPPEPVKPPGPDNPDPTADPERTSLESNREEEPPSDKPVPIRTGLALEPDQLAEGDMGVRVGNTNAAGYDADVAPGQLQGFVGSGAGGGDGQVVQVVYDHPPELVRTFQPKYPPNMKSQGIEGRVLISVTVLTNGRAGAVELLQGVHPDLDRVAMASMSRFRWRAARRDGRRVESTAQVAIRFVLRDD